MKSHIVKVALLSLLMMSSSCSKDDESSASANPTSAQKNETQIIAITANEAERGKQACDAYVSRICKCSETQTDLERKCQLAKAMPGALSMNLRASEAEGNMEKRDKAAIIHSARQIIRKCIEAEVRIDDTLCPRPGTEPPNPAQ